MEITRQADYAMRAVLHVAGLGEGERSPTSLIAAEQDVPLPFLAKIISQLAVKGIVDAMRGASGGVRLARPAEDISLLEVVEAIDGPLTLNRCVLSPSSCKFSGTCPMHEIWLEVREDLVAKLSSVSIADLHERSVAANSMVSVAAED